MIVNSAFVSGYHSNGKKTLVVATVDYVSSLMSINEFHWLE